MAFDPSVIGDIGSNTPDMVKAKSNAYTLAAQMDQNALRKIQLHDAEQTYADQEKAKQIVKGAKNDTAEDRLATAERLRKEVGPEYSNKYMREIQGVQSGDYENQIKKMQVASAQQELIVDAVDSVVTQVQQFKANNPNATNAMLDAKTQELGAAALQGLAQSHPELTKAIAGFAQSQGASTYQGWKAAEAQSKEGRARIQMHLKEHDDMLKDQDARRKDDELKNQQRRTDIAEDAQRLKEKQDAEKQKEKEEGLIDDPNLRFMADQYLAGDKSVLQGITRGKQGQKNMVNLRAMIREEAIKQGLKPVDVAARMASYAAFVAEETSVGKRQATILTASKEFDNVSDIVESASKKVARGNWVPMNVMIQKLDQMRSDPKLGKFAQAIDTTVNVYARAIAPTGVSTADARQRALDILSSATSQEDFDAKLDVMKQEIQAAIDSPDEVKEMILKSFENSRKPKPGSPAAAAAAATPGAGAPSLNASAAPGAPGPGQITPVTPPSPPQTVPPGGAPPGAAPAGKYGPGGMGLW